MIQRNTRSRTNGPVPGPFLAAFLALACAGGALPGAAAGAEGAGGKAGKASGGRSKKGGENDEEFQKLRDQFDKEKEIDPFERLGTIVKFGDLPSKKTTDFLSKLYEEETNPGVFVAITQALSKIGSVDAVKAIVTTGLPLLSEHGLMEDLQAALSRRMEPAAEDWFIKNALSPSVRGKPETVAVVIKAVGKLRSPAKVGLLLAELKKAPPDLQIMILEALRPLANEKVAAAAAQLSRAENPALRIAACDVVEASGSAKYKQLFIAGLKDPHWEMRVLSIDALGKLKEKDFTKHAVALLKDKDERVKVAAVNALLQVGGPESVDALIKGMESATGRVLDDIADALARLTKKNLGAIHVQWEGWWAQNKDRVKDFTPLSPEELARLKEEEQKNKATAIGPYYFGLRVLSKRAAFAVDCSESMEEEYKPKEAIEAEAKAKAKKDAQGKTSVVKKEDEPADGGEKVQKKKKKRKKGLFSRLDLAKREVLSVVKELKDGAKINILRFDTQVSDLAAEAFPEEAEKKALLGLDPKVREAAEKYVKAAQPAGLTNLMGVIRRALEYDEVDTIFLLSDGAPTVGITDHDELLAEVARLNRRRRVKINVISFNPLPTERKLLQALSEGNYGVYVEK
jgi:HEAT repeat protein